MAVIPVDPSRGAFDDLFSPQENLAHALYYFLFIVIIMGVPAAIIMHLLLLRKLLYVYTSGLYFLLNYIYMFFVGAEL